MMMTTEIKVGDKVRTNRIYGVTAFADLATVLEVTTDWDGRTVYVIQYDEPSKHEGDFMTVRRFEGSVIPLVAS